jgi:hypothetical protein
MGESGISNDRHGRVFVSRGRDSLWRLSLVDFARLALCDRHTQPFRRGAVALPKNPMRIVAWGGSRFSRFLLSLALLLLLSTSAESFCIDDVLQRIDKDTLLMRSNAAYRILDDWRSVVFWLPLSKVTICDEFGNVDDDMMIYYDIYNHDQNQIVPAVRER